jgi:hypothetical protein
MKKIILGIVFVFATVSFTNANNEIKNDKPSNVEYVAPDCWAGADAAETNTCGSVGCNFDLWAAVYSACMGY